MQLTPSRVRIQKLGKAAGIAIAENIVLKRKVDELTTASSSRQKRKALDQSVLSKGRLITMDEVEQIRKEEEERKAKETERKTKAAERKAKAAARATGGQTVSEVPDSQETVQQQSATMAAAPWEQWSGVIEF